MITLFYSTMEQCISQTIWILADILSHNFTMALPMDIQGSLKLRPKSSKNIIGLECEVSFDIISTDVESVNNSNTFEEEIYQP